jgi:hypothetical protein
VAGERSPRISSPLTFVTDCLLFKF